MIGSANIAVFAIVVHMMLMSQILIKVANIAVFMISSGTFI